MAKICVTVRSAFIVEVKDEDGWEELSARNLIEELIDEAFVDMVENADSEIEYLESEIISTWEEE